MQEFLNHGNHSKNTGDDLKERVLSQITRNWDVEQDVMWWGEGWHRILGYESNNLHTFSSWQDNIHPDDLARTTEFFKEVFASQQRECKATYRFKNSDNIFSQCNDTVLITYQNLLPIHVAGFMTIIPAASQVSAAPEPITSLALFHTITDASTAALWITDEFGSMTYVSKAWIEWTGAPLEMHLGRGWLDFVAEEDLEMVTNGFYHDLNRRVYHQKQFCIIHTDSTVRCVVCKGAPQYNEHQQFTGYIGAVTDITELAQAQKELEFSEEIMRSMIQQSPVAIGLFETDDLIIKKVNPALLGIIDKDESTILGMNLLRAVPELAGQTLVENLKEVYRSGEVYESFDTRIILNDKDGPRIRYFNIICTPIKAANNQIMGIMLIATDFTWQHHAHLAVKAGEQKFRSIIEESPVACALFTGRDLVIEFANEAMIKILGKGNSILGKKVKEALPELEGQPYLGLLDQVYCTGTAYHSHNAVSDLVVDGILSTYHFDFSYTPLFDANHNVYGILEMAVDVTERVKALTSLQHNEQRYRELASDLEKSVHDRTQELKILNRELQNSNQSLEQFAYAASHDLQEPLRKVISFGSRLESSHHEQLGADGKFLLSRMQDASLRMSKMIDDLLSFSRLRVNQKVFSTVDPDHVVRSVLSDLEISIQEKNAVFDIELPFHVWGDAGQLALLFLNLIGNALKYQPSNQIPYIRITSCLIDHSDISLQTTILPNHRYLKITIQDNGIGFDQKHVQRIFQMFQRLHGKNEYSGFGIGLALCSKVVQNHHGLITAEGEPGIGSRFTVYLPVPPDTFVL